jgi:alpha-1,6-mannosyltransferase
MKLCALTQSYAPTGGGVRTMLHAERAWCERTPGMQHVLIVPGESDTVVRDGRSVTYTVRSRLVPGSATYRLLLRSDKVLRILRAEMPDVVEVHCAYNLPWTAMLHRRRHGGIVSGVYMTDLPVAYIETPIARRGHDAVARRARALAERYVASLYRRCDVVIAISPVVQQRLHAMGVRDARCIPLGVDLDTFHPSRRDASLRARLGAGAGSLVLAYAGRLDAEKQPDVVLDAFERARALDPGLDAHLVIAGDGPLRQRIAQRGARVGNVNVLPFEQDRGRLAALLASADVYVSAMAHETFGLSVVEAQACGLPVLGVRAGAMTDRVHDGEGFLVPPDSPAAMAERILKTPRDAWHAMGRRARQRVQAEFSWNRTFEMLTETYRAAQHARDAAGTTRR